MKDERQHCHEAARELLRMAGTHMALVLYQDEVADLIARERSAARAEALEDATRMACAYWHLDGGECDHPTCVLTRKRIRALKESK